MMKKLLFTTMLMAFALLGFGQVLTNGDYRTRMTGNWSDSNMWETRAGGVWATATTPPAISNNIYIQNGHSVTIDVASAFCNDLQINTLGVLFIGENILNVNGKIRAYTDPTITGSTDGVYTTSTTSLSSTMISTIGSGVLRFIGGTRNITNANEWGNNGTTNSVEFALEPDAVGSIPTAAKFRPTVISSGTIQTDDTWSSASGDFTIKSGATFLSTKTGSVLRNNSSTKMGVFTIESGAFLELTGSAPTLDATSVINNGTVTYSRAGTQTLLGPAIAGSALIDNYYNLILSGTSAKTSSVAFTVSNLLDIKGTAGLTATTASGNTCTMLNGSTISRSSTVSTPIGSTSVIILGTAPTDLVNLTIGASVNHSGELTNTQAPGKIGTLTVNNGIIYTITSNRPITNLVNNGVLALTPASTLNLTINGDISGSGTITGNSNASINFAGTNSGNAGVLNFTTGSQVLNNLIINRTGANASLTLGTSVSLNGSLSLTSGVLNIMPLKTLELSPTSNINGAPFSDTKCINTQVSGNDVGKVLISGLSSLKIIPVGYNGNYLPVTLTPATSSDFEINVFEGATADATPNGTPLTADQKKRIVNAVWNINRTAGTGNCDVTLGWQSALEGTDFSGFTDAQVGVASYSGTAYAEFTGSGDNTANTASLTVSSFSPMIVGELNTTLPVKLISFTAQENLNSVKLSWKTTSEKNLAKYIVQHAYNGSTEFKNIYSVAAHNLDGPFDYSFVDVNPVAGVNYYRLVSEDIDGTQYISEPKSVSINGGDLVTAYPNPVVSQTFSVSGLLSGDVIKISDLKGQVLMIKTSDGNATNHIDVQNIKPGVYILSIENSGKITTTKRLVKL